MLRLHPELKGVPVYPTQLMTAVSDLMLFFVAIGLYLFSAPNGVIFIVLVLAHQSFRLMIEPYRFDQFFDNQRKNHTIYFALLILFLIPVPLILGSWLHWIDFFTAAAHPGYSIGQIIGQSNFWFITFYVFILTSVLYGVHGTRLGSIAIRREQV
ncbi:MAG: hypothetical protein BGO90_09950 [Legionella sp. 40-6]|nr:MAG: hypothetical protein BGO90_09950 [Legionella sp. 40-6]